MNAQVFKTKDIVTFKSVKGHMGKNGQKDCFWNGTFGMYCLKAKIVRYGLYCAAKNCWEVDVIINNKSGEGWLQGKRCNRMLESEFQEYDTINVEDNYEIF